jgi:hypothetical protein
MRSGLQDRPGSARHRRSRIRSWLAACAAALLLSTLAAGVATAAPAATTTSADDPTVITDWNALAMTTLAGDTTKQGPETALYMGFVQAAVYNAVVGIEGRYAPYRFHARAPRGASTQAAAVAAAHKVLVTYSPYAQATLDTARAASLAQIPDGKAKTRGIAFGSHAAEHLVKLRAHDGRNAAIEFTQPPAPGVWRPTPPGMAPMVHPWMGFVTPLLVRRASQFAAPDPPALTSAHYTRDFAEVKAVGSASSTVRTPAQTDTARFYSGNAVVQFNAALRDQVAVRHLDIVEAARMFAAIDMSLGDAVITVWYAKYRHGYWRPITAINLADTDGNPATIPDASWVPLIASPAYPEYPSGYVSLAAVTSHGLAEVLATRHLRLTLISTAVPGVTRQYDSGPELRRDVVDARVWLGIHFRFADTAASDLGVRLADWTVDHYFQPVRRGR